MSKQPKTLYDLKQNLGYLEEKRTRLLKDRDMLDHRLKAQKQTCSSCLPRNQKISGRSKQAKRPKRILRIRR